MSRSVLATTLSLLVLAGCQGDESGVPPFAVTDSAGVTIVESTRPLWESGDGWTLSAEPELVIGRAEGDERYLFSQVVGVRRLSDGRIAVLDAGAYRVRLYDSAGIHLMDLGEQGDGPSEFRYPQFLGVSSDTLFVYEQAGRNLSWFSPDGQFLRTSSVLREVDGRTPNVQMFGYSADGVGIGLEVWPRASTEGLVRQPYRIWSFDLLSPGADTLFSVPGYEEVLSFARPGATLHRPYVFGKTTLLAASEDQLYLAPNEAFSVQVFDEEGELRQIIRRSETPRRVSSSDFDEWVEEQINISGASREERAEMRRTVGELSMAETMPAFRSIAVDTEDNLWIEEWKGVGFAQGPFSVFGSDGAWLGAVALPDGLPDERGYPDRQVLEIGPDYVLGVWADGLGVEQVRLYRIEKN